MKNLNVFGVVIGLIVVFATAGCRRPYDTPKYEEISSNETGFLVPLEGESKDQAKLKSVDFLKNSQVATKRVQITHRWNQTGRWDVDGEWIDNVKLIKVDRTPVTREWSASTNKGSENKDQGVWVESYDSVGFSTGFSATAFVQEEDAATYLYYYTAKSLKDVMDSEVRGAFQAITSLVALRYKMDILRGRKQEIIDSIKFGVKPAEVDSEGISIKQATTRPTVDVAKSEFGDVTVEGVIHFFKRRGVTITTVGNFGGFEYENKDIQKSIDQTFIAQQEKVVNAAKLAAQDDTNKRINSEATSLAEAAKTKAEGEANGIRAISKAAAEAQQNPMLIQLKLLDIQMKQMERWDGKYPVYMMTTGAGPVPTLMLNVPSPASK